jgi:hypothetical protein
MSEPRVIGWVSGGAASAVACKLAIAKYGDRVQLAYKDTGSEDPDTLRFLRDVERWLGAPITFLRSTKYTDTWDVWERNRFLRSPAGAKCTSVLKVQVGREFQRPGDIQIWGFTTDEAKRAGRFTERFCGEMTPEYPLIDQGLSKEDCFAMVTRAGMVLPKPYLLGFDNNNCIPCVKATGARYWNRVRRHYPEQFARMAELERRFNFPLVQIQRDGVRRGVFLDQLDPEAGADDDTPEPIACGIACHIAEQKLEDAA